MENTETTPDFIGEKFRYPHVRYLKISIALGFAIFFMLLLTITAVATLLDW